MKIKKINEFNNDRYYCFSEKELNREVYAPERFGSDFCRQFDDMTNKQIYDLVLSLYDFVNGDRKPNIGDRDELLEWVYEYAVEMLDE